MTTKSARASITTDVVAAAPAAKQPQVLTLVGPTIPTLAQASVHIRQGYVFDGNMPLDVFAPTGQVRVTLVLGSPEAHYIEVAKTATADALAQQEREQEKAIEEAAKRLIEQREREERKAVIQAQIEQQQKELDRLQIALRASQAAAATA